MGKYLVVVSPIADKHLKIHKKSGNKATLSKIKLIFRDLEETPYEGVGHPEQLKHGLAGFWSRRINRKDRLIYKVTDKEVKVMVVSALGHYGDK